MGQQDQTDQKPKARAPEVRRTGKAPAFDDKKARHAITIEDQSPQEIYDFWRDLTNLPRFMKGLREIRVLSPKRSHWVAQAKTGETAEWDAEITEDRPGLMLAWQTLPGATIPSTGEVWFTPASLNRGTVVSLAMDFHMPGGKITEVIEMLKGEDPDTLTQINLHRLKCLLQTGEIATTEGQSSGRDEQPPHKH